MVKLLWQPPGQEPVTFSVDRERVSVGRDQANDICLPESAVSARHAVLSTRLGVTTVHDLNSSNGTWVNQTRVESQQLQHGDVVQFGRLAMSFVDPSKATHSLEAKPAQVPTAVSPVNTVHSTQAPNRASNGGSSHPQQIPPDAPEFGEIDRLLGSIRSHRNDEEKEQQRKSEEMFEEWKKVMGYCTALKTRLSSETRVRYFDISERRNEVIVRFEPNIGQPTQQVSLSWGHMERRGRAGDGIWMRRHNQPDKRFEKCADAVRDLVTTVAHMLA